MADFVRVTSGDHDEKALPSLYLFGKLPVTDLPLPRSMFGHDALRVPVTSGDQGEKAPFGTRVMESDPA